MKLPRASTVVASVFGIGFFEFAPGTIMSAIAVPLAILIALHGGGAMGILSASLIAMVIGTLACADHVRETKREDPPECVIDELAGQWLACAFCLLPVSWADNNIKGGLGVMADDMIAGLMAGILVALVRYFFRF